MQPFPIVGVLALQGDYESHARALEQVNAQPKMVRTSAEIGPDRRPDHSRRRIHYISEIAGARRTFRSARAICPHTSHFWYMCRMHSAGEARHPSGPAESWRAGRDRGTQCLWPSDRQRNYHWANFPARRSAGNGFHSRSSYCESGQRGRSAGDARWLAGSGAPR